MTKPALSRRNVPALNDSRRPGRLHPQQRFLQKNAKELIYRSAVGQSWSAGKSPTVLRDHLISTLNLPTDPEMLDIVQTTLCGAHNFAAYYGLSSPEQMEQQMTALGRKMAQRLSSLIAPPLPKR